LLPKRTKRTPPGIEKTTGDIRFSSRHSEDYALKSIQLRLIERKYLEELRNEIDVLRSLDHPNIVKAYEVYETKGNIYVIMEYCSGGDLYARAPYTETESVPVISQICSAIGYMHKKGVVHRDLKIEK
jgi:calcium-dependent protein kinase